MKKLILIRHGETDYTLQKKYCGHGDTPLNTEGIAQAKTLRAKLKNIKIDRIYSSDLKRAFETAGIVFQNKTIYKRKGLREIDFGKFCGLTWEVTAKLYPAIYRIWMNNPEDAKIPGGESIRGFTKRVKRCFSEISKQNLRKTVALVTHGGPIRIILLKIMNLGLDKFWDIEVGTAACIMVDLTRKNLVGCLRHS